MNWLSKLLQTFDYDSATDFLRSLLPSIKYQLVFTWIGFAGVSTIVQRVFGIDALSLAAFMLIMITELCSGIMASKVRKDLFSSMRLSRFVLKMACYLVVISVPYLMGVSFANQGKVTVAAVFVWLHSFLIVQVTFENIISVLENLSVIEGKDKTFYIKKIRDFLTSKFTA